MTTVAGPHAETLTSDGVDMESTAEGFYSPRELTYIRPARRRLTEYEAVICNAQPDLGQFDVGGWLLLRPDGKGTQEASSTKLVHPNWFEFRDPSNMWQRPYIKQQAQHERAIANAITAAKADGSFLDITPGWYDVLAHHYEALASFEWGMFRAHAFVTREALSDTLSVASTFSAMDRLRHQQDIALYSLDLHEQIADYAEGAGNRTWLEDPVCQPARRLVERLMAVTDWGEMLLITNLVVEPLYAALVGSEFFRRLAPLHGDVVTPVIEMTNEIGRARSKEMALQLVRLLTSDTDRAGRQVPAAQNRETLQAWVNSWYPDAIAAVDAFLPLFDSVPAGAARREQARQRVLHNCRDLLERAGLQIPQGVHA
ncbi:monooxygenase [Mycobacterium sp. TY815]|uniref:monooxygenase n=1 Tax=Mycobacterium sp. TY815 TaxID=3050581 RepID=UPI000F99571E|nr:monooxygenase [Mycobacterium sp. TY815]MDP7704827.1 monooxygenase [Mycobacterium sp. TY815]RUP06990.1 MAG: monooxygenase [Mycobacterium sp.]